MTQSLRTDAVARRGRVPGGDLRRDVNGHPFPGRPAGPTIDKSLSLFRLSEADLPEHLNKRFNRPDRPGTRAETRQR